MRKSALAYVAGDFFIHKLNPITILTYTLAVTLLGIGVGQIGWLLVIFAFNLILAIKAGVLREFSWMFACHYTDRCHDVRDRITLLPRLENHPVPSWPPGYPAGRIYVCINDCLSAISNPQRLLHDGAGDLPVRPYDFTGSTRRFPESWLSGLSHPSTDPLYPADC